MFGLRQGLTSCLRCLLLPVLRFHNWLQSAKDIVIVVGSRECQTAHLFDYWSRLIDDFLSLGRDIIGRGNNNVIGVS